MPLASAVHRLALGHQYRRQCVRALTGQPTTNHVNVLPLPEVAMAFRATQATTFVASAAVAFGLVAILVARFMARGITTPLMQLSDVADRISLGELNAKIQINRKDEIGNLAEALRRMQVSLQTAIERLRAKRSV